MTDYSLDTVLAAMGDAGLRMSQIDAAEGAAGNISVYLRGTLEPGPRFPFARRIELPVEVPHLAAGWIVITASSRRLRDIGPYPERTLCLLDIADDGRHADMYAAPELRPTSELNTHLAVHNDHVGRRDLAQHAVIHAQPIHLAYISHIPRYQETRAFNRRLLRWQPETVVELPEGIGVVPFEVPGTLNQSDASMPLLSRHRAIIWARHGIMTRADIGVGKAADLVEYAEAAARYEYLNLQLGEPTEGLSDADMRLMCQRMGIEQEYF